MPTKTKAEVQAYLDKHGLRDKMEKALNTVLADMPDDPMAALAKLFAPSVPAGSFPRANTLLASPPGAAFKLAVVQFVVRHYARP